jgi:methylmalonyl-CoA/ethylmalonyl-CoA epimerase
MIYGIDHLGLLIADPATAREPLAALGMRRADGGVAEAFGVSCEFWDFGDGAPAVELVSPTTADSAVRGKLERDGPGLYHIAFTVDDLECELKRLGTHGFSQVTATPCAGARDGMEVAFLYLRRPVGLLIELVRYADRSE